MTSPELDQLNDAFKWEQERMQVWIDELNNEKINNPGEPNAIKKLLGDAWVKYFQTLKSSDQQVIKACNDGSTDNSKKNTILGIMGGNKEYDDVFAEITNFLDKSSGGDARV
jgi:hypothetical protein